MFNDNIGLVFSGGGAKGSYQIGAWKALRELRIDKCVKAVSSSSVGGFNSALFLNGDINMAEDIWKNITLDQIYKINDFIYIKDFIKKMTGQEPDEKNLKSYSDEGGILARDYIDMLVNKYLNIKKIKHSPITCITSCCEIPAFKVDYITVNNMNDDDIKNAFLATSAYPVAYTPITLNNKLYVDGGLIDNFPIKPLYDLGYRKIIIITCSHSYTYDKEDFQGADITAICPSEDLGGWISGTYNFTKDDINHRMELGYLDAMNILKWNEEAEKI